jgi:hypothetical protein
VLLLIDCPKMFVVEMEPKRLEDACGGICLAVPKIFVLTSYGFFYAILKILVVDCSTYVSFLSVMF